MIPRKIKTQTIFSRSKWSELVDRIKEYWDKDYFITDFDYGEQRWRVVMSKVEGWNGQSIFHSKDFPSEKLSEYWKKDKYLTSITYDGTDWICVVTGVDNCYSQAWATGSWSHCKDYVNDRWNENYIITSIACNGSSYAFICSKFAGFNASQKYKVLSKPVGVREIEKICDTGQIVVDLFDMAGDLVAVTASDTGYTKQRIHKAKTFMELDKIIDNRWEEGYNITTIAYFNNECIIVFSK